jgi:hypothetical protein
MPNATVRANARTLPAPHTDAEAERLVVVPKRERNPWIVAADYAAIALLTWTVMFAALVAFKVVTHV